MNYNNLALQLDQGILTITLSREKALNALNKETLSELRDVIETKLSLAETKAAIITGAGPKAFAAGADISEFSSLNSAEGQEFAKNGQEVFHAIENAPKPILAAVNGFALGGGCELAMACHIRIASSNARFGQPEVKLGLIPGYGGTQRLTQLVGKSKAMQWMLTGEMISAQTALDSGLISEVTEPEALISRAREILSNHHGTGATCTGRSHSLSQCLL